jgi:choice-of-anchor C domain-containing protein
VAIAISLATDVSAAPFTNGNFEDPGVKALPKPDASLVTLEAGSTVITGWTVGSGNIDYTRDLLWQPADEPAGGKFSLDLNGLQRGSIFQTFDTTGGQKYKVVFCLAGNPDGGPNRKTMEVVPQKADGTDPQGPFKFEFDVVRAGATKKNMKWTRKELEFTGYERQTKLSFNSTTENSPFGPAIDAVALIPPTEFKETPLVVLVLKNVNIADETIANVVKEANIILREHNIGLNLVLQQRDITNGTGNPPIQDGKLRREGIAKFTNAILQVMDMHIFKKGKGYTLLIANDVSDAAGNADALAFTPHSQTMDEPITFLGINAAKGLTAAQLGRTLAHEIAHYLTLGGKYTIDCLVGSDAFGHHQTDTNNLMFAGAARQTGSTLTPHQKAEIARSRSRLRGIAKGRIEGPAIVELPTKSGSWTDTIEDVATDFIDLSRGSAFVDFPGNFFELSIHVSGLHPPSSVNTEFGVFLDTQNRSGKGQARDPFAGADKIVRIRLAGQFPFTNTGALIAELIDVASGIATPLAPGIVERVQAIVDVGPRGVVSAFDFGDAILQVIPLGLLGNLADQVPIGIQSIDRDTGEVDEAMFIFEVNPGPDPLLEMSRLVGQVGSTVTVQGTNFSPASAVSIFVDGLEVLKLTSLVDGSFSESFVIPSEVILCDVDRDGEVGPSDIKAIFAERRTTVNHFVTAMDENGLFDFSGFERTITREDARICSLQCTDPRCAP